MSSDAKTLIRGVDKGWAIKCLNSDRQGEVVVLDQDLTTVGRSEDSDIQIEQGFVSREHAAFMLRENKLFLVDNGSSNGTLVNGKPIDEVELCEGDKIEFDEVHYEVLYLGQKEPEKLSEMKTMVRPAIKIDEPEPEPEPEPASAASRQQTPVPPPAAPDPAAAMQETQVFSGVETQKSSAASSETGAGQEVDPNRTAVFTGSLNAITQQPEAVSAETIVQPAVSAGASAETPAEGNPLVLDELSSEAFAEVPEGAVCVRGLSEPVLGQDFELSKSLMRVGRSPFNEIVIKDSPVSTQHAEIKKITTGKWSVVDKNSSNGTYINDKEITGEQELHPGDIISFGSVRVEFDPFGVLGEKRKQSGGKGKLLWIALGLLLTGLLTLGVVLAMQSGNQQPEQVTETQKKTENFAAQLNQAWHKSVPLDVPRVRMARGDFSAVAGQELVLVTANNTVSFLSAASGEELSRYQASESIARQPLVYQGNQLVLTGFSGRVWSVDSQGSKIWSVSLPSDIALAEPQPRLSRDGSLLLFPSIKEGVIALEAVTGKRLWASHQQSASDPVIDFQVFNKAGQQQLLTLHRSGMLELFLLEDTGLVRVWQLDSGINAGVNSLHLGSANAALLQGLQGKVKMLDLVGQQFVWQQDLQRNLQSKGIVTGSWFYLADMQGALHIIDAANGEIVIEKSLQAAVAAPLASFGRHLAAVDLKGAVYVFARNGELLHEVSPQNAEAVAHPLQVLENDSASYIVSLGINGGLQAWSQAAY